MDPLKKYQVIAILAGMAIGILASRRWRGIRYSTIAFVLVPQAIVLGYLGRWEAASIAIVLAIISVMIDSLVSVRRKQKPRGHR